MISTARFVLLRRPVMTAVLTFLLAVTGPDRGYSLDIPASQGRAFLFCVLPSRQLTNDSIHVVFRSSSLATATVSATSVTGKPLERVARIVDTRRAATVSFARKDIELRGEAADSSMSGASQVECAIRTQVVRITADSAVTAVVIGGGSRSSYAMDLLPLNLVGRSYVVASMPSTVVEDDSVRGTTDSMKSGHSQCVIIAREDSTTVRLQIRGVTTRNSRGEKSIVLQAGEAFLMQAALDTLAANGDLSGAQIIAAQPRCTCEETRLGCAGKAALL